MTTITTAIANNPTTFANTLRALLNAELLNRAAQTQSIDSPAQTQTPRIDSLLRKHVLYAAELMREVKTASVVKRDVSERRNSLRTKLLKRLALASLLVCDNMTPDTKKVKQPRTYRVNPTPDASVREEMRRLYVAARAK